MPSATCSRSTSTSTSWLPADPASYGFDNIGDVLGISSGAARTLSLRGATRQPARGRRSRRRPERRDLRLSVRPDAARSHRRTAVRHARRRAGPSTTSRWTASTCIQLRLGRNYNTRINGLDELHQIEVMIDGERVQLVIASAGNRAVRGRAANPDDYNGPVDEDDELKFRMPVKAGPRVAWRRVHQADRRAVRGPAIGRFCATLRNTATRRDCRRWPRSKSMDRTRRPCPSDTPSRRRIFVCRPAGDNGRRPCAQDDHLRRWRAARTGGR